MCSPLYHRQLQSVRALQDTRLTYQQVNIRHAGRSSFTPEHRYILSLLQENEASRHIVIGSQPSQNQSLAEKGS